MNIVRPMKESLNVVKLENNLKNIRSGTVYTNISALFNPSRKVEPYEAQTPKSRCVDVI